MTTDAIYILRVVERPDDNPRRQQPPERRVRALEVTTIGPGAQWFKLPDADEGDVVAALKKAGFIERRAPRSTRLLP